MPTLSYLARRGELQTYFDHTAVEAWTRLTSDAPVSGIRATVRAGRDQMRSLLLSWLPDNLVGRRILDAGCGTGAASVACAQRGADVAAVDLSPTLVDLARDRATAIDLTPGHISFGVGDMLTAAPGEFDHALAMDSLIHYQAGDMVSALLMLASRTRRSIVFTFAPRTPALSVMHAVGRLLPRGDRAPAIEPVSQITLRRLIEAELGLADWKIARQRRVASGFYVSEAMELVRR